LYKKISKFTITGWLPNGLINGTHITLLNPALHAVDVESVVTSAPYDFTLFMFIVLLFLYIAIHAQFTESFVVNSTGVGLVLMGPGSHCVP
jgi:hypothetical protein